MIIGKNVETGENVKINLEKFIDSRAVLTASSGQGKSWLIRKILQESFGKAQQIILDWEGEYSNLREEFDYLLVGKDGEIPLNIQTAEILAKKLMELSVSTIIDLSDLPRRDRIIFVKRFLDSLLNLPKELYNHLVMLFIDEAHQLAPQKGNAESMNSVNDAMSLGRKRGIGTTLCTQRIAKLNKDSVAEARNGAYGGMGLLEDRKRGCEELGFNTRELEQSLKNLEPGEFYIFGSAISKEVIKVKIGDIKVKPQRISSRGLVHVSKTPEAIKKILKDLKDLPKEAQQEFKDKEEMRKEITRLRQELTISKRQQIKTEIGADPKQIENAKRDGWKECEKKFIEIENKKIAENMNLMKEISSLKIGLNKISNITGDLLERKPITFEPYENPKFISKSPIVTNSHQSLNLQQVSKEGMKLRDGAMRMLNWLAGVCPDKLSKNRIATLSGFSVGGGTFNTYLSELKRNGWIEGSEELSITDEGMKNAVPAQMPSGEELLSLWKGKFRKGTGEILGYLYKQYPNSASKENMGYATGLESTGGTFNTYLSELRRNGLVEVNGNEVKISEEFFK